VKSHLNLFISGGTGSGKTTLLNVLSGFIPDDERIVTIEDAAELKLNQEHVISLESRPPNLEGSGAITIRELVRNSLRMRPDRIIVGEVRGGEALDMLQAMNTGHDGSLATGHANTPRDALARLETMVLMAGMDLPSRAIREQIASAIHVIVQVARLRDGSRKVVRISEITGMEGDVIAMQDLFVFDQAGVDDSGAVIGTFRETGLVSNASEQFARLSAVRPT
jgi:pilus assembly protein CpaF